jgi:flagellar hook-basal body complex protein FliE
MVDRIISPSLVANTYGAAQKAASAGDAGGVDFGALVKTGLENAVNTIKGAESASTAAVIGKADLNDVVQAITKAELTLQTIVAIRDRLIGAYQEILRMPI